MTKVIKKNLDDFRCMHSGRQLGLITTQDAPLLDPVLKIESNAKQKALLVIHGFSSSPAVYRRFMAALTGYDAIIVPALPGHATNLGDFAQVQAVEWLVFIEHVYVKLAQEYAIVEVMGLSLGGALACYLSSCFPLAHLYLLAPALELPMSIPPMLQLAKVLRWLGFTRLRNLAGNLHTNTHCEIAYRQLPLSTIIEILSFIQSFEFMAPKCPTDLFLGRFDAVVDSKSVAALFVNNLHTHIHWLENSAHVLPLDGDVDFIVDVVNRKA